MAGSYINHALISRKRRMEVGKTICLTILGLFLMIIFINPAFAQSYTIDCYATLKAWREDPRMKEYAKTCSCPVKNQSPVCNAPGSAAFPLSPAGKALSPSQQMALGIVGGLFQNVFSGMFNDLIAPPRSSSNEALVRQQQEEKWRKEQEAKIAAYNKWVIMQAEEERKKLEEEAAKKRKGEEILAKTSIGSGGLKMETIGGGQLAPFSWDSPRALAPAASGKYDTSKFSAMERLLCASYFSKMGEKAANSGDIEGARFYGTQMDNIMQGLPTAVECQPPKELSSMTADMKKIGDLNQKYTQMSRIYQEVMPKIENLQDIEIKLNEVKRTREDAEKKIKEIDQQIGEIKTRKETADSSEKKAKEDDLLAQAMALKADAEKQQQEAVEAEEKLIKEKQGIEEELNKMKEKMQGDK